MLADVSAVSIPALLSQQRSFFATGATRPLAFRRQQLQRLAQALEKFYGPIQAALQQDLHKPELEIYGSEIALVKDEIKLALKQLKRWTRPQKFAISPVQFPGSAQRQAEPLGVALIIGPWNYPVQLILAPLVGAIAAGNCALLKPSELTPHTSQILAELIAATFDPQYIALVEGGIATSQALLAEPFDHIFLPAAPPLAKSSWPQRPST